MIRYVFDEKVFRENIVWTWWHLSEVHYRMWQYAAVIWILTADLVMCLCSLPHVLSIPLNKMMCHHFTYIWFRSFKRRIFHLFTSFGFYCVASSCQCCCHRGQDQLLTTFWIRHFESAAISKNGKCKHMQMNRDRKAESVLASSRFQFDRLVESF